MAAAILTSSLLVGLAMAQTRVQSSWGQCGGSGYSGPTACPQPLYCTYGNPWYSQCVPQEGIPDEPIPGAPGVPDAPIPVETTSFQTIITITPTVNQPIVVTTFITFLTPVQTSEPTEGPATITYGGSTITILPDSPVTKRAEWIQHDRQPVEKREETPKFEKKKRNIQAQHKLAVEVGPPTPKQLQASQYWIRAVVDPNFHKYLQTNPANEPGTAVVGPPESAGQYNVADGQLVSSWTNPPLYLHVEKPADFTQRKLATWFNTTKNDFGTFTWSGDALTWSTPEVKRQNLAAWLVCEAKALFINTGAYAYQTPAGCADQTIHYYNGATANN